MVPDSRTIFGALGRHPVHAFPARMAPDVAASLVRSGRKSLRVLDPMMGSGTVLALAQAQSHQAIGIDIDPLAALIAGVWTCPVAPDAVRQKAEQVLQLAKRRCGVISAGEAYPVRVDAETREFIDYWFDVKARKQLASLSSAISRVRGNDVRNVLWCALSKCIIAKRGASRALDLVHSRPHRFFDKAPILPFSNFLLAVNQILAGVPVKHKRDVGPRAKARLGDARNLRWIRSGSIDLVLTSPPYLNAIDYMRCSKFSLVWMGFKIFELTRIRSESVGTEVGKSYEGDAQLNDLIKSLKLSALSPRQRKIISSYIFDMRRAVSEVARVLVPQGKAVYVIGENTIRGVYVRNSKIISILATSLGLHVEKISKRVLPPNRRYLPPPSRTGKHSLDTRMRTEIILHLMKPA